MSDNNRTNPALTLDEVRKVLEHLQSTQKDPHAAAAFALPALACLRRTELLSLRAEHVDEEQRCLYLGTMRPRVISYPESLCPILHELVTTRATGPLFDGPSHLDRALRHIRRTAVDLGIEKPISYKVLRGTFITLMAKAGVDMFTLLAFAGMRPSRAVCGWARSAGPARDLLTKDSRRNQP
jgi:integrase